MNALARRIGCTEGQLYTSGIGLLVAVALLVIGLPPVLRTGDVVEPSQVAAASDPPADPPVAVPDVPSEPASPGPATPPVPRRPSAPAPRPSAPAPRSSRTPDPAPAAPADGGMNGLSVVSSGYTSSTSGTPLSGPEVPEDGLPVGTRLGRVDKMSFLRLAGSGTVLRLRLVDEPAAHLLVPVAAVEACAITEEGWAIDEPGAPPQAAPRHDTDRCAPGSEDADGTWHFDLARLQPLDGDVGIALVPVTEGATTFQVTFSTITAPSPGPSA